MAGGDVAFDYMYSFRPLPTKTFPFLQDKDTSTLFMKWSMLGRMSFQSYSFDQSFYPYSSDKFALCFFTDPEVLSSLKQLKARSWVLLDRAVVSVDVEVVPCTKVSMELFDPIYSCGVVRPSGHMIKCFHDFHPDYDELKQMLQEEDTEHYYAVGKQEREEFLFCIFKHLCLGGELCQYEDTIQPYIKTTKQVYKDLISVQKDPNTQQISVVSIVLKVSANDGLRKCFPGERDEEQTFAYLIVDPFKRHVTLFCHFYGVGEVPM